MYLYWRRPRTLIIYWTVIGLLAGTAFGLGLDWFIGPYVQSIVVSMRSSKIEHRMLEDLLSHLVLTKKIGSNDIDRILEVELLMETQIRNDADSIPIYSVPKDIQKFLEDRSPPDTKKDDEKKGDGKRNGHWDSDGVPLPPQIIPRAQTSARVFIVLHACVLRWQ